MNDVLCIQFRTVRSVLLGTLLVVTAGCGMTKSTAPSKTSTDGKSAVLYKNEQKEITGAGFSKTTLDGPQVAALSKHPLLNEITFYECNDISDDAFAELAKLAGVKAIHFIRCDIDDAGLRKLARMPAVRHLTLSNSKVTAGGIAALKDWKSLRRLTLTGRLESGALRGLAELNDIEEIEISTNGFTASQLADLPLPGLRKLELPDAHLTDDELAKLTRWKTLREFTFVADKITDAGVGHLTDYPSLTTLSLAESKVTVAGLKKLSALPKLEKLNLYNCQGVTNGALKTIASLPALKWVSIEYTSATGDGLMDLASSKTLRYIGIGEKKATKAATEKLAKAMPNCKVERLQQLPR